MKFLSYPLWWQLFLTTLFLVLLLTLREIYRFQLLNSKYGKLTTFGGSFLVLFSLFLLGTIFFKVGLFAGIFVIFILVFFVGIVYEIFQKLIIDKPKEIETICNNTFVKNILKEFNVSSDSLKDILNRPLLLGNKKAIENIKDFSKLRVVLQIITQSPEDWTEEDKFIEISNFLEYGKLA